MNLFLYSKGSLMENEIFHDDSKAAAIAIPVSITIVVILLILVFFLLWRKRKISLATNRELLNDKGTPKIEGKIATKEYEI